LATIEMLVRLAAELKMLVVAEGIETDAQRQALLACGVDEGQGYLVSPPLPAANFLALLEQRHDSSKQSGEPVPPPSQVA
jgi:EAL domain-containing protein (putative c-di-GMP-specific phosphodiesterase class I)